MSDIIFILSKKERTKFFFLIAISALISITELASIAFLFVVVNFYAPQHGAVLSVLCGWGIKEHSLIPAVILLILFLAKTVGAYYFYKFQYKFVFSIASRISSKNLLLYLEGNYVDHVNIDSSVFIRKINHHPIEFAQHVLFGVQQIITESILILISVIALLLIDAKLLIILSLVLFPAVATLRFFTRKKLSAIKKNIKKTSESTLHYLNEALSGFIESNIYDRNDLFVSRYEKVQKTMNSYIADLQITQGAPSRFFELFAIFGLVVLIIVSEFTGAEKIADFLTLGAFTAAAYKIIPGISRIVNYSSQVRTYRYALNELSEELHKAPSIPKKNYNKTSLHSIEFKNVCFSYNNNPLLSCVNFGIGAGKFVGVNGYSGRGKTTLINLLLGFLSPQQGAILFNGKALEALERKRFWNKIAYVKQEPFILHDSVLNNVTLFEIEFDHQKLNNAIEASDLKKIIDQFPEGVEKIITEDGKNISGGQRQRIAIARALYKDADVIILDEPFNELDEQSELAMLNYFKQLARKGKIIVLITHNTKSLSFCDSVIMLSE